MLDTKDPRPDWPSIRRGKAGRSRGRARCPAAKRLAPEDDPLMIRFPATVSVVLLAFLSVTTGCATSRKSITTPSGLTYTVPEQGSGPVARAGQHVLIHETASFPDGRVLYTTRKGRPLRFLLGAGQVIDGVDEGVTGMRVG